MKSFYIAKSLLFLCSIFIFINLVEVSQNHFFSLDTLIQIGLLMITLELSLKTVCSESFLKEQKSPNNTKKENQSYSFIMSKLGGGSVIIGYLIEALTT